MARSSMFSYNDAQRAKAGDKHGYRKDASPSQKKAPIALEFITKESKALALPCVPIPAIGTFRIRTCEDLFWALSTVLVAWLVQQGIEASSMDQALKAELSASLCSPTHQECPQQLLQQCGEDGSSQAQCQGHEEAAGTKPAAAGSPTLAFVYVKAGCSSRCSSDSAANMAMPVEQEPSTEQDDTAAADAHCNTAGSSQQQLQPAAEQAAAGKGKLQLCAGDSDILQQEEEQVNELASPPAAVVVGGVAAAAAAAAAAAGQPAGVHRPSWLQRTFAKLLSCGSFSKMADV